MFDLDLSNVKEQKQFEALPAGKYLMTCTNAELKDTKDGTGKYIKIELTVKAGEHEGRKLFSNFNIVNKNQQASEIGQSQLKSFLVLSKYATPERLKNVTDLCGLTVGVKTKIKSDAEYGDKAEVSYYMDASKVMETVTQAKTDNLPF